MAEYIEREAILKQIHTARNQLILGKTAASKLEKLVNSMPTVDVVEVRHGRWLPQRLLGEDVVDCSECKTLGSPQWKWCPVCGAMMDGKDGKE